MAEPRPTPPAWVRHRALGIVWARWPTAFVDDRVPPRHVLDESVLGPTSHWRAVAPTREDYLERVVQGSIPTRPNWHDAFNLVTFACFPAAKHALHRRMWLLRRERLAAPVPRSDRGREEDALSLLDEASIVVAGPAAGLAAFDEVWEDFEAIDRVVKTHRLRLRVFGHALLEHLVVEGPTISAGVVLVGCEGDWGAVDDRLAEMIDAGEFPEPRRTPRLRWPLGERWVE